MDMLLNKKPNGNYSGFTNGGKEITLHKVSNMWRWTLKGKELYVHPMEFNSHIEAAADVQAYIDKHYVPGYTVLLPEDIEPIDTTLEVVKDLMGSALTDKERDTFSVENVKGL